MIARLKPGVTRRAGRRAAAVRRRAAQAAISGDESSHGRRTHAAARFLVGDTRLPLLVLLASVALLLLIACANVGILLLVQAAAREREAARAPRARRGTFRLVRQALAESLVLSLAGGACGLLLGWAGTRVLEGMQPPEMLRVSHFSVDGTVLLFVTLITLRERNAVRHRTGAARAPARSGGRAHPVESRGGTQGRRVRRWGDALVVSEVAIALMLTVGAGLLGRSFWRLRQVEPGFDPNGVLAVQVSLNRTYDSASVVECVLESAHGSRARAAGRHERGAREQPAPARRFVHERLHRRESSRRRLR